MFLKSNEKKFFTEAWLSQYEIKFTLVIIFQLAALFDAWSKKGIKFGVN